MSERAAVEPQPAAIGGVPKPPFARTPDPPALFAARAARFRALAATGAIGPYLAFLGRLSRAQARVAAELPAPPAPDPAAIAIAREHAMPPLDRTGANDVSWNAVFDRCFAEAATVEAPPEAALALARVAASAALRDACVETLAERRTPDGGVAEHAFVAAALQVVMARRAARLDAARLVPVGPALCPACGGPPVSSIVVGWIGAEGARYCSCALCGTLWNVVRVTCTLCATTANVGYTEIAGEPGTVKAETCGTCGRYAKILYANKDHRLDPVADDVASVGLDMMLKEGGATKRGSYNPYLLGY